MDRVKIFPLGKDIRDVKLSTFGPPTKNIKIGILAEAAKGEEDEEKG